MRKIRILYIDDEAHNLNAFKASFRRKYEIYTVTQVPEARKLLREYEFPVIIADQRMPETTGVEFFNSIKETYPNAIRILVTAFPEVDPLVKAINKGQIYRYVKKPWDYYDLQSAIENAYDLYETRRSLTEQINSIGRYQEERGQFIQLVSGDIQNILLSSLAVINLAKTESSDQESPYFKMIEKNLYRLRNFVQQMASYYRNSAILLKQETVHFESLIQDCVKRLKHLDQSIRFQVNVIQEVPFEGDVSQITITLDNLITNAILFKEPKRSNPFVRILVKTSEDEAEIEIEDNGVGIEREVIDKIFDLFYCTPDNVNEGFGIGLYIVKTTLARMEGHISVFSTRGEGTKFSVYLPNRGVSDAG